MTDMEKFIIKEILENAEITTEVLLQKLDELHGLDDEIYGLKQSIKNKNKGYEFALKKEKEHIAAAEANPNSAEVIEEAKKLREMAEKALKAAKDKLKQELISKQQGEMRALEKGWH